MSVSNIRHRGFTLVELLISIGIIALLAAIVMVAINPTRQLAQGRDAVRQADVLQILKAVQQHVVEYEAMPSGIDETLRMIGTDAAGCSTYCGGGSPSQIEFTVRVATGNDDVEEWYDGTMSLTSSDLDLIYDGNPARLDQLIGIRFQHVSVPQGATVEEAFLTFTSDGAGGPATLQFYGEATDDAAPFTSTVLDVSNRTRTVTTASLVAASDWLAYPPAETDDSPDLSALIEEIVARPGWTSGNDMAFIIDGTTQSYRVAVAYDVNAATAPLLTVRYQDDSDTTAESCLDLSALAPEFLSELPADPLSGTPAKTNYAVQRLADDRVRVRSCAAEASEVIAAEQ